MKTLAGVAQSPVDVARGPEGVGPDESGVRLRRPGAVLGERYCLAEPLGEGSVGLVFRAIDQKCDRRVAVKLLREEFAHGEILERFFREARVLSRLAHPNIISVTDFGLATQGQGTPYLVLELLEGRLLETEIDRGPLGVARSLRIARQILSALAYAHGQGVVHRDLKPGNLWLTDVLGCVDHVKVLDFGLARLADPQDEAAHAGVTRRGYIYGSPEYMSPEQAAGDVADARSDLYSVGVVLFEMLTGKRPFWSSDARVVMQRHMLMPPPRMRDVAPAAAVPEEVEAIVARALRKARGERWQEADSMLRAIDDSLRRGRPGEPGPLSRRASTPVAAAAAVPPRARARVRLPWPWFVAAAGSAMAGAITVFWALG